MTAFTKKNFSYHGGYLHYQPHTDNYYADCKFVARFKHRGPITKALFVDALIKHYTVEDYFDRLNGASNTKREAPLQILMNDGILVYDSDTLRFTLDGKLLR